MRTKHQARQRFAIIAMGHNATGHQERGTIILGRRSYFCEPVASDMALLLQAGFAFESDLKTLEYVVSGSETQLGVFQYPSILANLERKRT